MIVSLASYTVLYSYVTAACIGCTNVFLANSTPPSIPLVRPVVLLTPALITFNQGDTVSLDCEATGIPLPDVSWFQDSVPIPNSDLSRISQAGNSLVISGVEKGDEGAYVCQAVNSAGSDSTTITLAVNGE